MQGMIGCSGKVGLARCCSHVGARGQMGCSSRQPRRGSLQPANLSHVSNPQVFYKTPQGDVVLVDVWQALYKQRLIFLHDQLDWEQANMIVAVMLYLDMENQDPLRFVIHSEGGDVASCLTVYDTMKHVRSAVSTVAIAQATGMAGFLLAMGRRGKRGSLPNTTIMLQNPAGRAQGQASDLQRENAEIQRARQYFVRVLSLQTGHSERKLTMDLNFPKYFRPRDAREYGIVDHIIRPRDPEKKVDKFQ